MQDKTEESGGNTGVESALKRSNVHRRFEKIYKWTQTNETTVSKE